MTQRLATKMILLALAATLTGCTGRAAPDLGGLYTEPASLHHPDRNPVIVIPGILGTRLIEPETDTVVWGAFGGGAANPQEPDGARLVALPMREGEPLADLGDGVATDGVLDSVDVNFLGLPIELDAYRHILGTLGVGGYRDEMIYYGDDHFTCFQFDYDWRRDIAENAEALDAFIRDKRAYVREELLKRYPDSKPDVHFDIVAHSMGGLLTRYFLRYGPSPLPDHDEARVPTWDGAEFVDRAILVGTPNAGSATAIRELVKGTKYGPTPAYEPAVLGTMPAVYQLLPRRRHRSLVNANNRAQALDPLDEKLWERMGWGLAAPDQDRVLQQLLPDELDPAARRRIALDHQRKCLLQAKRLRTALDLPATPPADVDLELYLIAGDAKATLSSVSVDLDTGAIANVGHAAGDGVVARSSALMDERIGRDEVIPYLESPVAWRNVTFLFEDHLGLTTAPAFTDNVLFLLLEQRPARLRTD